MTMALINPADWRIPFQLNFAGVVYGAGDAVPSMTEEEAENLRAAGTLLHVNEARLDPEIESLLAIPDDGDLLHELRGVVGRPWTEFALVRALLDAAITAGRSAVLIEALRLYVYERRSS
jgi:hypothetical protein